MQNDSLGGTVLLIGCYLGVVGVGAFTVAALVITLLMDPAYQASLGALAILIVGAAIKCLSNITSTCLVALNRERLKMLTSLFSNAVFLAGCIAFVPRLSYYGVAVAAVGSGVADAIGVGLSLWFERKLRGR